MPANSENIITNQVHTGDSSIQTVTGEKFKGDGYYGRSDGLHTVQYNVNGLIGTITMQGTLALDPSSSDWFSLNETIHISGTADSANANGSFIYNFTGNYVWVRAIVTNWTDGSVQSVVLNH
jgi:hypothetical protein